MNKEYQNKSIKNRYRCKGSFDQSFKVLVGVVTHGPDGTLLESSYKNRDNAQYVQSLGRTIRSVAQVTPDSVVL